MSRAAAPALARRHSRIAVGVLAFVCAAAVAAAVLLRPWAAAAGEKPTVRTTLRSGAFVVTVKNGSAQLSIAQVFVNDAFVGFRASQTALAPHDSMRLVIDYPWVRGESYELGLLTATGDILQEDVENAGGG